MLKFLEQQILAVAGLVPHWAGEHWSRRKRSARGVRRLEQIISLNTNLH